MKKATMGPQTLLYPMPAVLVGADVDGRAFDAGRKARRAGLAIRAAAEPGPRRPIC